MSLTHTDTDMPTLRINSFETLADYQAAYAQGLIDSNELSFIDENLQADWGQSDPAAPDYIKNKPDGLNPVSGTHDGTDWTALTIGSVTKAIPTVNNGILTIQKNGASVGTFSANQSGNSTINIVETQELPNVDSNDNGKILVVQNGSWTKGNISMQRYYAGAAVPSESLGTDGDLYLQIM